VYGQRNGSRVYVFFLDFPPDLFPFPSYPDLNFTRDRQLGAQFSNWTWQTSHTEMRWVRAAGSNHPVDHGHANAADIEDPEIDEITNRFAYVRCYLRLGLQFHQITCFPPVKLYIFLPSCL